MQAVREAVVREAVVREAVEVSQYSDLPALRAPFDQVQVAEIYVPSFSLFLITSINSIYFTSAAGIKMLETSLSSVLLLSSSSHSARAIEK